MTSSVSQEGLALLFLFYPLLPVMKCCRSAHADVEVSREVTAGASSLFFSPQRRLKCPAWNTEDEESEFKKHLDLMDL